jgi:hypothetical protein
MLEVGSDTKAGITVATCLVFEDNLRTESYFKEAPDITVYSVLLRHRRYIQYPWRDRQPLPYRCRREERPMVALNRFTKTGME